MNVADYPGIEQFRLEGRTAIVTGGSKGLGFAMAAGLASAGAKVMIVSRHINEAVEAAHEISSHYGIDACGHQADVNDAVQVQNLVKAAWFAGDALTYWSTTQASTFAVLSIN